MKILIVDDQEICRVVLQRVFSAEGYECIEALNGKEAVELFDKHRPDLVLMDVVMPVMNGYEAAPMIKEIAGKDYVPIIFLTSNDAADALKKCLECGGDDFLQKPVDTTSLQSKIHAHMRTRALTQELHSKTKELEKLHETLSQEHETGQHVLTHSLSRNLTDCKNIRSYIASQSTFNGDLFLTARKPFGGLYVFLGDLTGHGLAAAIGTIPLSQVFFTMTRKGKPAASIVREMNRSLRSFVPRSMFCAAAFVELNATGTKARVWSGGIPLCFHIKGASQLVEDVPSRHLPLGVLDNPEFDASLDELLFEEGDSLLFMTDGIPESVNPEGAMFGMDRVGEIVRKNSAHAFERLMDEYQKFAMESPQEDDVSLLQLSAYKPKAEDIVTADVSTLPWRTAISLNADYLKKDVSIASELFHMLPDRVEFAVHQETIATVIAELFSNALEHGILGLASSLKSNAEGFQAYYDERARRLAVLEEGVIELQLAYGSSQQGTLELVVKDSGYGFKDLSTAQLVDVDERCYGRGLKLVASLCSELSFNEQGNEVRALIRLA